MGCFYKRQKRVAIANTFQIILDSSKRTQTKYGLIKVMNNSSFKKWLKDNDIEMHSTYNQRKSVVAERFIKALKNKVYKHITAVSKNVYLTFQMPLLINAITHSTEL